MRPEVASPASTTALAPFTSSRRDAVDVISRQTTHAADQRVKDLPLGGLKVLDLTQFLSGPYCTQILADLGAEVTKVEAPQGDLARHIPPHFVGKASVYYLSVNRTKKSV